MTCQSPRFPGDARDYERSLDEVERLAKLDARGNVDPRELSGELAAMQEDYLDAYTEELCVMAMERGVN